MPTLNRDYYISATSRDQLDRWIAGLNIEVQYYQAQRHNLLQIIQSESKAEDSPVTYSMKDFTVINKVDDEYNGWVWKCTNKRSNQKVIVRVFRKACIILNEEIDRIKHEKYLMGKLSHPFLNKFMFSFQSPDRVFFAFEYIEGTKLLHYFIVDETFPEERIRFHCAEIVIAMQYMHQKGVLYRGLTTENLWLRDNGHICLSDFSCSKALDSRRRTGSIVTFPFYTAPEILQTNDYGFPSDWWMLGILTYEMFYGKSPFVSGKDTEAIYHKVVTETIKFSKGPSKDALDFMQKILQKDPSKRLCDPEEIKKHAFFRTIDWVKIENQTQTPPYIPSKADKDMINDILKDASDMIKEGLNVKFESIEEKTEEIPEDQQAIFEGF